MVGFWKERNEYYMRFYKRNYSVTKKIEIPSQIYWIFTLFSHWEFGGIGQCFLIMAKVILEWNIIEVKINS